jgi:hypothetical protein
MSHESGEQEERAEPAGGEEAEGAIYGKFRRMSPSQGAAVLKESSRITNPSPKAGLVRPHPRSESVGSMQCRYTYESESSSVLNLSLK